MVNKSRQNFKDKVKGNFYLRKYFYKISSLVGPRDFRFASLTDLNTLNPVKIIDQYLCYTDFNKKKEFINPVRVYKFDNCLINSRSSSILQNKVLYHERINENEDLAQGNLMRHNAKSAIFYFRSIENISEGFFLAGNGSQNWYHWLIEILPKILFYEHSYTNIILVDDCLKKFPTMIDSLKKLIDIDSVDIKYLSKDVAYKAQNLFFVSEISKIEFSPLNDQIVLEPQSYFRPEILKQLAKTLISKTINAEIPEFGKKIYLIRNNTHRSAINEKELRVFLQAEGFEVVDLMELTLDQQISLFHHAEFIIGISGAAWSNMIFSKPGTKALIFSPDNFKQFSGFQEIASIFDIKMQYFFYENNGLHHTNSDFNIDLKLLSSVLKDAADGYKI